MKRVLPFIHTTLLLVAVASAVNYYFVLALPSVNEDRLQFEREEFQGEYKQAAAASEVRTDCNSEADAAYWDYVRLNATFDSAKNAYTAQQYVWDQANEKKKTALDYCYRKHAVQP